MATVVPLLKFNKNKQAKLSVHYCLVDAMPILSPLSIPFVGKHLAFHGVKQVPSKGINALIYEHQIDWS